MMSHRSARSLLVAACVMMVGLLPSRAGATDPALARYVSEVLARNPGLKARTLERDSAKQEASAAGIYPDPELAIMVDNVPERMGGDMPMVRYQVSQMLPWPGKLSLMEQAMARRTDARAAAARVRGLDLEREAKRAYFMLSMNAGLRQINRSSRELLTTIANAALARYGAGTGGHHEVVRAEVERNAVDVEAVDLEGERVSTVAMMNALRNSAADTPITDPPLPEAPAGSPVPPLAELVRLAEARRPELGTMRAMQREETSMASLARRERLPDFMASVWYNQNIGGPDAGGLMVGASLPLFNVTRQNRRAQAADLRAASAKGDLEAMQAMIRFEVADARRRLETAIRTLDLVVNVATPRAQQSFASSLSAFSTGTIDIVGVLDAWRALQSVEQARIQALVARSMAITDLERAVAGPIPRAMP
jgi:outer membrane protein, heavy metal efflux system